MTEVGVDRDSSGDELAATVVVPADEFEKACSESSLLDGLKAVAERLRVDLVESWPRWVIDDGRPKRPWNEAKAPLRPLPFAERIANPRVFAGLAQFTFGEPGWGKRSQEERKVCRRDFERAMHEWNARVAGFDTGELENAREPLLRAWRLYVGFGEDGADKRLAHLSLWPSLAELFGTQLRSELEAADEAKKIGDSLPPKRGRSKRSTPRGGGGRPRAHGS